MNSTVRNQRKQLFNHLWNTFVPSFIFSLVFILSESWSSTSNRWSLTSNHWSLTWSGLWGTASARLFTLSIGEAPKRARKYPSSAWQGEYGITDDYGSRLWNYGMPTVGLRLGGVRLWNHRSLIIDLSILLKSLHWFCRAIYEHGK